MISSDLYIFPLPSISACHGQVVVHVGAPFVWAVIWSRPKYSAGVSLTKQQRVYQAVEHHPVNGFKWNFNVRDKKVIRFNSSMCQMCINVTKQKKIQFTLTGPVCRLRNCRKSVQTPAEMSEIRCKCHSSVSFLCLCWRILFSYFMVMVLVCYSVLVHLFFYHWVTFGSDPRNILQSVPAFTVLWGSLPYDRIFARKGWKCGLFGFDGPSKETGSLRTTLIAQENPRR